MFKKFKVFFVALIALTTVISYIPVYGENIHGEVINTPCVDRTELFKKISSGQPNKVIQILRIQVLLI